MGRVLLEKLLAQEFSRFLVVGFTNTLVTYSLYLLLNIFLHYQLAYAIAYVLGIFFSYWLNARWVFKSPMSWKSFFSFPLVYVVQYAFQVLLLHTVVEIIGLPEWMGPLLITIATIPLTFVLSRYLVKTPSNSPGPAVGK